MAIDQETVYVNALTLLGQRRLSSLTENREPRHVLDGIWNLGAVDYCLEIVQPTFAAKTTKLTSSTTSTEHDFDNVFTLPSDYISIVGVYSDANLDQEINRYIIEGLTLACNYSTIYVRYTSNGYAISTWSASFARVVAGYLAREAADRLAPAKLEKLQQDFIDKVEAARSLESEKEPQLRSSKSVVTLSNAWRNIYNDALLIMGLDEITANDDDSNRRAKLDRALNANLVESLLEDTGWVFGLTSTKIEYNASVEPSWGYNRAHDKPSDLHRLNGIYHDEYMRSPLKYYMDEGNYWFTDEDTIYIQYISTSFLTNPSNWPAYFAKLVAARLAKDAAMSLAKEGANVDYSNKEYEDRKSSAMSNDAMISPPRMISRGNWTSSRYRGNTRGRPGDY